MFKISSLKYIPVMMLILTSTGYADFQFIFNGHTYLVITTSSSWEVASAAAKSKTVNGVQGYLAHIDNLQENTAIFDQLMANIPSTDFSNTRAGDGGNASYIWIGANDISAEGTWVWVDDGTQFWQGGTNGSPVDGRFNNWPRGFEPDNYGHPSREQDAAGITLTGFPLGDPWGAPSQWNDVGINNNLYYVVEFDTEGTFTADTFKINAGLNDAWYNPDTDGQGFFITVFPDLNAVSLAWFTYDTELPAEDATANLGDPGHRWLTAVGPIVGNQANMEIEMTSGGLFDTAILIDRTDPPGSDGTIMLKFTDCNSAAVEYDIPSINKQGIVPIRRVANDNIVICEALSTD
jgi:hypothetical protein